MIPLPQSETRKQTLNKKLSFHETPGPPLRQFFLYRPETEIPGAPIVVSVHGIARNAAAHTYRLMEQAERYGVAVLSPLFEKQDYGQYQQLEDAKTGVRSDLALLDMIAAAERLSSADGARILLFGFSGGAQFAHRFAMAHPDRVLSAVLAAAGWYTLPDPESRYPYGLDAEAVGSALRFNLAAIAQVQFHVMVGQLDVERDSSLRRSKRLDRTQGRTRVERASTWVTAMSQLPFAEHGRAPPELLMLPKVGHSFVESVERADLAARVFERFAADAGLAPQTISRGVENVE